MITRRGDTFFHTSKNTKGKYFFVVKLAALEFTTRRTARFPFYFSYSSAIYMSGKQHKNLKVIFERVCVFERVNRNNPTYLLIEDENM
jgi:hypothetical protein